VAYPEAGDTDCPCDTCAGLNNGADEGALCCTDLTSVTKQTDTTSFNYATRDAFVNAYLRQISFDLLDEAAGQEVANYGHCDYGFTVTTGQSPPFARFNAAPQGRLGNYPTVLPISQFTLVEDFRIQSSYTAWEFEGFDRVGDVHLGGADKSDLEKCAEVCLSEPHCRAFSWRVLREECYISYINRDSIRALNPDVDPDTTTADWDGLSNFNQFDADGNYDYYERDTTPPTVVITSADTAPRFTDECTYSDSDVDGNGNLDDDTYLATNQDAFTITFTFDRIVQNYRRLDGPAFACGDYSLSGQGAIEGWGMPGSRECEVRRYTTYIGLGLGSGSGLRLGSGLGLRSGLGLANHTIPETDTTLTLT